MTMIFYLLSGFVILWELYCFLNPLKVRSFLRKFKKTKSTEMDDTQNFAMLFLFMQIIWCFIGLFTSQWLLFGVYIFMGIIPLKRFVAYMVFDSLVSIGLLLFIIINKYHLHYTMQQIYEYLVNRI